MAGLVQGLNIQGGQAPLRSTRALEQQLLHVTLDLVNVLLAHRVESTQRLPVAFLLSFPHEVVLGSLVKLDALALKIDELVCVFLCDLIVGLHVGLFEFVVEFLHVFVDDRPKIMI